MFVGYWILMRHDTAYTWYIPDLGYEGSASERLVLSILREENKNRAQWRIEYCEFTKR